MTETAAPVPPVVPVNADGPPFDVIDYKALYGNFDKAQQAQAWKPQLARLAAYKSLNIAPEEEMNINTTTHNHYTNTESPKASSGFLKKALLMGLLAAGTGGLGAIGGGLLMSSFAKPAIDKIVERVITKPAPKPAVDASATIVLPE